MELTRFQKAILAVMAGMLVLFGLLMIVFHIRPGVLFEDSLLKTTEYEDRTVYSGKAHDTPVTVTVTRDPGNTALTTVDFTIGTEIHDVCGVEYPLAPIETKRGYSVDGIRITKNGAVLFDGGYDPESEMGWFDANGEFDPFFSVVMRAHVVYDPWYGYETSAYDAVRFALGPSTSAHGDLGQFALAVFLSALLALHVIFWRSFFRFGHRWARDPEPTVGYQTLEHISWVVLTVVIAAVYVNALVTIK